MFLGTTDPFPTNFLDVSGNIKIANINVTPPPIVKNINIDLQLLNELIKAAPTNPPIPLPTNYTQSKCYQQHNQSQNPLR